jgi:hypothetical protein
MKKRSLLLGLAGGVFVSIFMVIMIKYCDTQHAITNMLITYTAMIIAFSVIFVAIKKERDNNGGVITFGKAFRIGLTITLITSTIYAAAWVVYSYFFMPDFIDKYTDHLIQQLKASHLPPQELKEQIDKANRDREMYGSLLGKIIEPYMEILPVGLFVSLIAALILWRRGDKGQAAVSAA